MQKLPLCLVAALGAAFSPCAFAQNHSLLISPDGADGFPLLGGAGAPAIGTADQSGAIMVTPDATTPYQARPFQTNRQLYVHRGDTDGDGNLSEFDTEGDTNCLFVPRHGAIAPTGPIEPSDLFRAIARNSFPVYIATTAGNVQVNDGDAFRARNGQIEVFVRESMLSAALGDPNLDFDLDSLCQDPQGNLYFSGKDNETLTMGPWATVQNGAFDDGDIVYIPASAITYDAQGLITAIAPDSALFFAREADVDAMVTNAVTYRLNGNQATTVVDIGGMDLDPNGGTWTSPQNPSLTAPNIVFGSNFSNFFDSLWSTAANTNGMPGSPAVINGATIAHTDPMALPDGSVFGVGVPANPDSIGGLVIIPEQTGWIGIQSPNGGVSVAGVFDVGIGRVAPNSPVTVLVSFWNLEGTLPYVLGLPIPSGLGLGGNSFLEVDGAGLLLGAFNFVADANGYVQLSFPDPLTMSNIDLLMQVGGIPYGSSTIAVGGTTNLTLSQ